MTDHQIAKSPNRQTAPQAIILAAGKGKRMGSDLPKVVHPVAGEPMVRWVVRACLDAGCSRVVVVVGHKGELVREALRDFPQVAFAEQTEQLGTAHAARMAEPHFMSSGEVDVFVLTGDGPLIRSKTLVRLLELHRRTKAAATLATAVLDDPTGYGRIIRNREGGFEAIVEQKDATPKQLAIQEINPSYYCFKSHALFEGISQVGTGNAQGEYYLTDVPGVLKKSGKTVSVIEAVPPEDVLGINTPDQLADVDRIMRGRLSKETASTGTVA